MYKILIIEDDEKIVKLIEDRLIRYGYAVVMVKDYSNIKGEFIKEKPHLVLLDINLPNIHSLLKCLDWKDLTLPTK